MFKSFIVSRIKEGWIPPALAALEVPLGEGRFVPCGATQRESYGWVEPRGEKNGPLVENVGGELIFKLAFETKKVPAKAVKKKLEERCDKIEQETGRRPKGKHKKELKEEVELELLPHVVASEGSTLIWVSTKLRMLVIGVASQKAADRIVTNLLEVIGKSGIGNEMAMEPLQTNISPTTAMSNWLTAKEAPAGFSIDRECELKAPDGEKSTVRYSKHTLDIDEIVEHIKGGKQPQKLAMTWDSRVSFLMTGDLSIKKVELLDVVLESKNANDSGFDADVAISTGELSKMIPEIIEVLGGHLSLASLAEDASALTKKLNDFADGAAAHSASTAAAGEDSSAAANSVPWDESTEQKAA